ncbi:MAG: pyridoxamine 5'-phosphate oxidase family protein [Gammaproteobacteria bacterium]
MSEEADKKARGRAQEFLAGISTLTLATSADNNPWAATVFFAADSKFNLYFVSDHRTRHGRDMADNACVAATINPDCDNWHDVAGLQIRGTVAIVEGVERAKALAIYLKKFPQIDALFAKPEGEHEETIAARLKAANFYKLVPEMIRVIDNAQGFGYREEFAP